MRSRFSVRSSFSAAAFVAAFGVLAGAGSALAASEGSSHVSVYDFAVQNPVDDSPLPVAPSLGETVPRNVSLVPTSDDTGYAYFYYNGRPVIVDLNTRSVVRFGQ